MANALEGTGFRKGDAIAINMPMNVHAVIIYLAIVLAGCAVVSVADSFAPSEIASRLKISNAKGIFTQVFTVRFRYNIRFECSVSRQVCFHLLCCRL